MPESREAARPTRGPVAILAGTRPECLKLVSLVRALRLDHKLSLRTFAIVFSQLYTLREGDNGKTGRVTDYRLPTWPPATASGGGRFP